MGNRILMARTKCAAQNPQGRRNKPNLIHGYGSRHSPQLLRILNGECHLNKRLLPCPPKRGVRFPSVKSRQTGKNGRDAEPPPNRLPFFIPGRPSPPYLLKRHRLHGIGRIDGHHQALRILAAQIKGIAVTGRAGNGYGIIPPVLRQGPGAPVGGDKIFLQHGQVVPVLRL